MDEMISAEWANRTKFAEAAETLKIPTDDILAITRQTDNLYVLYTTGKDPNWKTWAILLKRDKDGILQKVDEPMELPGFIQMLASFGKAHDA